MLLTWNFRRHDPKGVIRNHCRVFKLATTYVHKFYPNGSLIKGFLSYDEVREKKTPTPGPSSRFPLQRDYERLEAISIGVSAWRYWWMEVEKDRGVKETWGASWPEKDRCGEEVRREEKKRKGGWREGGEGARRGEEKEGFQRKKRKREQEKFYQDEAKWLSLEEVQIKTKQEANEAIEHQNKDGQQVTTHQTLI